MHCLSRWLELSTSEYCLNPVCMQRWIHRTEQWHVHSLRSRQVFCDCGSYFGQRMSQLRHRHIFDGHGRFYMRHLPWKLEFRSRQHCLEQLRV